jgi:uncharacterized membrane protein
MTQLPATRHKRLIASLVCTVLAACSTPDGSPTAVAPSDTPLAAKSPGGGATYAVSDLGTAGYLESVAYDVNDAGTVVGTLTSSSAIVGFARVNGALITLPTTSNRAAARAVSNGSPTYVVGFTTPPNASSRPVRWTIDGSTIGDPVYLDPGSSVVANEVNDYGAAIGGRTIWGPSGAVIAEVDPPAGFTALELSDINNAGLVTLRATGGATVDRGFIRLSSGAMVMLAPPAGMEAFSSHAAEVSEQIGDLVYVAGKVLDASTSYAARWTFDVTAGAVTNVTLRTERIGTANAVSDAGTFTGGQGAYETMSPYAWRLDGTAIGLPVPKGGKQGYAAAVSPNGRLMTGTAQFNGSNAHALLWSGSGP